VEQRVLTEAFQQALEGTRLRAAVFLTFRFDPGFFEQEVLPAFFDIPMSHAPVPRMLHLAHALRSAGPVAVYYDRRTPEAGANSSRTDFQKIGISHRTGYFHPKNVLLLVDQEAPDDAEGPQPTLIVGAMSANLTRAGWWENVEVAHLETATLDSASPYRDDLLELIARVRRMSPPGADHAALDEILRFVRQLEQDPQRLSGGLLRPRLFTGQGSFVDFLQELAGNRLRGRCLEVIAPYFDDKESARPLQDLIQRFRPSETRVFLPRGPAGEALCSEPYWEAIRAAGASWARLPAPVVRLTPDQDRFVHAKVYRFFDPGDRRETFFVGSVNLTNAGFNDGGNVESGFLVEVEGRRRSEWLLEVADRKPIDFSHQGEAEGLLAGPGTNLVLRYDWSTETATAIWDGPGEAPSLRVKGAGVLLGVIEGLVSRTPSSLTPEFTAVLRDHLASSSFVAVSVGEEPDAFVIVDELGCIDKPPLMTNLSVADILRFWSLLTDAQKQEFFETHAGEIDDEERALWMGRAATLPETPGFFGEFAQIYLSFGNLERSVRHAIADGRTKEALDRLFGKAFDSLRRFVERTFEEGGSSPVREYVTLLCAIQLLKALRRDEPEFHAIHRDRFELESVAQRALKSVRARFSFAEEVEREKFFAWFDPWFLRRAQPQGRTTS
jgi:hypothetical protein